MKKNIYQTSVTQRGQVTIPSIVRDMLNIQPYDKVTFEVSGDIVRIQKRVFSVEDVYGSVKSMSTKTISIDDEIQIAKDERAEMLYKKMKKL